MTSEKVGGGSESSVPPSEIRTKAYHRDRILALVASGAVNAEGAQAAVRSACIQASEMGYALLLDLRGAELNLSLPEASGLLGVRQNLWRWIHKVALVGRTPKTRETLRFLAVTAQNAGVVAKFFEDIEAGRSWAAGAGRNPLEGIDRSSFTILVVDDDPDVLEISSKGLAKAGFTVLTAASGVEALDVARASTPDLILLDVVMPDLDGRETCRLIKEDPGLRNSYVALASGVRTGLEDQAEGGAAGADGYIPRPVGRRELVSRVETLIMKRELDRKAGLLGG